MQTYFLKNNVNSFIKIGKSVAPKSRVDLITGQWPFVEIYLFHTIDGDYEKKFHQLFYGKRVKGEWYNLPDLTVDDIENYSKSM